MGMCGDVPPVVIRIHDCTEHLVEGGKKDASFIAQLFRDQMEDLFKDEKVKEKYNTLKDTTDAFLFDGASNVQLAGEALTVYYPAAHALHGSEHVISLWFADIAKLKGIKVSRYILFTLCVMHLTILIIYCYQT